MTGLRLTTAARGTHAASGNTGGRRGVWALALGLIPGLVPAPALAQLSVYPATIEFAGGDVGRARTITVENQGTAAVEVRIYLSDYDRAPDGGHIYLPFGEAEGSCRERLQAFPDQLAVEPGGQGEIQVRLEDDAAGCWGLVFVEKRTLTPSGITIAERIGVKVLAHGTGATREGRVLAVAMDTTDPGSVLIDFANDGERALDVDGEVEVRDMTGEIIAVADVAGFRVLPSRTRQVRLSLDHLELPPGRYVLVAILDFDGEYLAGGQALVEVKP